MDGTGIEESRIKKKKSGTEPINYMSVEIDFSQHSKQLDKLRLLADSELRTLENQCLYILINAIKQQEEVNHANDRSTTN